VQGATVIDYLDAFDASPLLEPLRNNANDAAGHLVAGLKARGLCPKVGFDLDLIREVMDRHPGKPRLFELANKRFQPSSNASNTFVITLEQNGVAVACVACRHKFIETNLREAYEKQSLLFDEASQIPETSAFKVEHPLAAAIKSQHIVVTTGVCIIGHIPDGLTALVRLAHLRAFVTWKFGYITGICTPEFAAKHALDGEGFSTIANRFWWKRDGQWKRYRLVLAERSHWEHIVMTKRLHDLSVPLGETEHC
jgi:hypothetical protein